MNMQFIKKLPIPKDVKAMFPLTEKLAAIKKERDEAIRKIFTGESNRLLLIVGPCSADREDAVMAYMERLAEVQEKVKEKILIVPRLYTGKPRSSGTGYMGLIHQPDPKAAENPYDGIISARKWHMDVLKQTGFTCADEMLYPENHRYLSDLLSYVAVGARSCEDQQHRLTASGLSIPVGFKNPTGGNLKVLTQSVGAAQSAHHFIYRGWDVKSTGNPMAHGVLRGYVDQTGRNVPNYSLKYLQTVSVLFEEAEIIDPTLIVDTNHANSNKDPEKQITIAMDVMRSRKIDSTVSKTIKGLMVESYLVDGCQAVGGDCFGQSITDPCLGWEKSEEMIYRLAEQAD